MPYQRRSVPHPCRSLLHPHNNQNQSRQLQNLSPRSTSGRVLTHAIRATATDGSPVAGFVAAAALRTRTVAVRTLRTRHAGGRVIREGTPPRSCGSCPRVRRYGFRPLANQASCSAAARIRTASATSTTIQESAPARRRNAARIRSADYRCHTPPPRRHSLRRGWPREIRAPRRLHASPSRTLGERLRQL